MGQSLVKMYVHITFSTKNREPLIRSPHEEELYNYLGGVCRNMECQPITVGGHLDHVHVLCMLSKKVTLVKLIADLKSSSSKWIKTKDASLKNFYRQDGYGAFSVNPAEVEVAANYIRNQHQHHLKLGFKEEFRAFLKKYNVEYEEKYVWD